MFNLTITNVGVIGGGLMGTGIALTTAIHEKNVSIVEIDSEKANEVEIKINKMLDKEVNKNKITDKEKNSILKRIKIETNFSIIENMELIIEAIPEKMKMKQDLQKEIKQYVNENTLIATNTSGLSISSISSETDYPENVIGLHFFYPANKMKLVEVIPSLITRQSTIDKMIDFAQSIGKEPVLCKDYPGFTVNRILVPMINEAIYCVMEGNSIKDVDKAMMYGANHPMGPLSLADFVGLDTLLATMEGLYEGYKDSKYRPCPLLVKLVESGKLGKKTGQGFYKYSVEGEQLETSL